MLYIRQHIPYCPGVPAVSLRHCWWPVLPDSHPQKPPDLRQKIHSLNQGSFLSAVSHQSLCHLRLPSIHPAGLYMVWMMQNPDGNRSMPHLPFPELLSRFQSAYLSALHLMPAGVLPPDRHITRSHAQMSDPESLLHPQAPVWFLLSKC